MTPTQYANALELTSKAKSAGFAIDTQHNQFVLSPKSGHAAALYTEDNKLNFTSTDEVAAFLKGWLAFAKGLDSAAGIDLEEIKNKVEQQRVAATLAGKKPRNRMLRNI